VDVIKLAEFSTAFTRASEPGTNPNQHFPIVKLSDLTSALPLKYVLMYVAPPSQLYLCHLRYLNKPIRSWQ
jgi:hypothetical protein